MDDELRDILKGTSKTTLAVGRKIGSTKVTPDDLKVLAEALVMLAEAVTISRRILVRQLTD